MNIAGYIEFFLCYIINVVYNIAAVLYNMLHNINSVL